MLTLCIDLTSRLRSAQPVLASRHHGVGLKKMPSQHDVLITLL